MKRTAVVAALLAVLVGALVVSAPSASAVGYLGGSGGISVTSDFGACGSATFNKSGTITGEYTAVGVVTDGTTVYNINTVKPILTTGTSVKACSGGAVSSPDFGEVTYTLEAQSTSGGGVTSVKECTDTLFTGFVCIGDS